MKIMRIAFVLIATSGFLLGVLLYKKVMVDANGKPLLWEGR